MNNARRQSKNFSGVTALIVFEKFTHTLNDLQDEFYFKTSKARGQEIKRRKTKHEMTTDIYELAHDLYPGVRYERIDISFT